MRRESKLIGRLFVLGFVLCGCAARERLMAPLPKTFLEDTDITQKKDRLPFEHAWSLPGVDWSQYHALVLKPVRTDLLPQDDWMKSVSAIIRSKEDYMASANEIATYFYDQLLVHMKEQKERPITIVAEPGPGILSVEIALTELEFSHPIARAGTFAVPVPGTGAALSAASDPHVTYAMRITDSVSQQLLATAADRKFSPARVVDLNKFTVSSANREIADLSGQEIAEAFGSDGMTKIEAKKFDWRIW